MAIIMAILVRSSAGFFLLLSFVLVTFCMKMIKSYNLNQGFCRLHQGFNSSTKGLSTFGGVYY